MRTAVAGFATVLAIAATIAGAGIEHTILNGVEVGRFDVYFAPAGPAARDAIPAGFKDQLQTRSEAQLRDAGIEVTEGGLASLLVVVGVVAQPEYCFADITSSLQEEAQLIRNGQRIMAPSWIDERMVSGNAPGVCVESIEAAVERTVDEFIEVYGAMNPGRTKAPAD